MGISAPLKSQRISGTVPLFVVGADDGDDRIREANAFQNLGADQRMNLHLLELFGRKASRLRDDVLGHGEFADVMQQRGGMQSFQFRAGHAEFLADFDGVDADALQVFVGSVILGFDGEREGLDRAEMEVGHLFHVALLVFELAQIEPVRTVNQVDHRQNSSEVSQLKVRLSRAITPAMPRRPGSRGTTRNSNPPGCAAEDGAR